MSLIFLIYGALAVAAFWATCRDEYLRWLGLWLLGGWMLSNILYFGNVRVSDRIGPYTATEIMVAVAAAWAMAERTRWLTAILVFNLISIAANIGLAINYPPDDRQIYLWSVTTNICFGAECLFAFGIGVFHGFGTGRFHRWFFLRGGAVAPSATEETEA